MIIYTCVYIHYCGIYILKSWKEVRLFIPLVIILILILFECNDLVFEVFDIDVIRFWRFNFFLFISALEYAIFAKHSQYE